MEYELKNIHKCLNGGYSIVCIVSKNEKHLWKIKERVRNEIKNQPGIHFFTPNQMTEFLDYLVENEGNRKIEDKRIRGYRVKVNYRAVDLSELD